MIKAFLFDYDGVITRGVDNGWAAARLAKNLKISRKQAAEWLEQIWRPFMRGKLTEAEVWQYFERQYGKPIDIPLRNIWFKWEELEPLPEMMQLVKELRAQGYIAGVVSNVFETTRYIVEEHGVYDAFDFRVISSESGYAKPEREIFLIVLEKLNGIQPNEVVFLDDREKNAEAANKLGMHGIYVTSHEEVIKKIKQITN